MAHNGGPRVPPRPPPTSLAGVHTTHTSSRNIPPPPVPGSTVTPGNGVRAPATMSVSLPPVTAPLSPLGSRHTHHHRLAPPGSAVTRRVSPVRTDIIVTNTHPPPPVTPVSLTSPRPDGERVTNEYVETPFARNTTITTGVNNNNNNNNNSNSATQLISTLGVTTVVDHNNITNNTNNIINNSNNNNNNSSVQIGTLPITPQSVTTAPHPTITATNKSNHPQQHPHHHHHRPETLPLPTTVITKQPQATFKKNHRSVLVGGADQTGQIIECHPVPGGGVVGLIGGARTQIGSANNPNSGVITSGGSIICPDCGRCRCESCQQPRPLPQRWVCDKKCLCSVDAIIDYTSCLCCVKGLYYHCSKDYELDRDGDGVSCADEPCSCSPHRRLVRWGCLLALTAALPCLLCYWPLRGCARGIEIVYAQHTRNGCRCRRPAMSSTTLSTTHPHPHPLHLSSSVTHHHHHHHQDTLTTPEKRLLDSSPDF